jgi:WD40 repeat protein
LKQATQEKVQLQNKLRESEEGHSGWVNAVAFSPDGQLVASTGEGFLSRRPSRLLMRNGFTDKESSSKMGGRKDIQDFGCSWLVFQFVSAGMRLAQPFAQA